MFNGVAALKTTMISSALTLVGKIAHFSHILSQPQEENLEEL